MTATRALGQVGEDLAAAHLVASGLVVLHRNWRCALGDVRGEIDLIARDGDILVIVEVKARRGVATGGPLVAVTWRKQQQLRRLASVWLSTTGIRAREVRFDVVGVSWPPGGGPARIDHVRGVC